MAVCSIVLVPPLYSELVLHLTYMVASLVNSSLAILNNGSFQYQRAISRVHATEAVPRFQFDVTIR